MLTRRQLRKLRETDARSGDTRLRAAMSLAGVTQVQVAEAIGVAQSQVSEDAAGKFTQMSLVKARAYAEFFGCEIDDLFPAREQVAS